MNSRAIIATHHKTGTAWMSKVFRSVAERLSVPFVNQSKQSTDQLPLPVILLNNHSDFSGADWMLQDPDSRILHLIRDPRDVIISGMHYHRTAREPWLHRAKFGQKTYQEQLNSLRDDRTRLIWEMENAGKRTIGAMKDWNYTLGNCLETKYEDLIEDINAAGFGKICAHLGFANEEVVICQEEFRRRSLFGRKKKSKSVHVRSGKSRQWEEVYDSGLAEIFLDKFGDVLIELGYEPDNSWVGRCKGEFLDGS